MLLVGVEIFVVQQEFGMCAKPEKQNWKKVVEVVNSDNIQTFSEVIVKIAFLIFCW
jgi:hypothetical protein